MSNNGLVVAILVVVVFVGLYWGVSALWLCKCQVKSDATGQTCILPADGFCSAYSWAMKGMSKDCKIEDCKDKFGSCENPSCSDKTKQENCGAGCTWNAGQAAIAAACTQNEGKEDGDCANKTTEDSCNQDPVNCSWTAARAAVPGFDLEGVASAASGLRVWQAVRQRGRLPVETDFGDGGVVWPQDPLFSR